MARTKAARRLYTRRRFLLGEPVDLSCFAWFRPDLRVYVDGDVCVVDDGLRQIYFEEGDGGAVAQLIARLDGSAQLSAFIDDHTSWDLLERFEREGWLVSLAEPLDRFAARSPELTRQLAFYATLCRFKPDSILSLLHRKTVLVIGLGGVGSAAAFALAGAGVGRLILNETGLLEHSSLNRQPLGTLADVGKAKVKVMRQALRARFEHLNVDILRMDYASDPTLAWPQADLALVCGECESVYRYPARLRSMPLIPAGYFGELAVVGPVIDPRLHTARWEDLLAWSETQARCAPETASRLERRHAWSASGSTIDGLVGNLLAHAALQTLVPSLGPPSLLGRRLLVSPKDGSQQWLGVGGPLGDRPSSRLEARYPAPAGGQLSPDLG